MEVDLDMKYDNLLENVHFGLKNPTDDGKSYFVKGLYSYFHYNCDGFKDSGWGCAYRTLQSMCSWIKNTLDSDQNVPNLMEIQEILVKIGDKPDNFINSREWIGALEVFYVIDTLYDVSCRIQHIQQSEDVKKYANLIRNHFDEFGGLIMMGGDVDCGSKGIAGIHISGNEAYLLIIDPHFNGRPTNAEELQSRFYVKWQHTSDFIDSSFYNLCLPQIKYKE